VKIRPWDSGAADPRTLRRVAQGGGDRETLRARCLEIKDRTGEFPVIEEVVPGGADRCVGVSMVVGKDHKPVLAYCVRRLKLQLYSVGKFKHTYELGANAYCESVRDPDAIDLATRFVHHARYTGAVTVEFKRSPLDGQLKFIKADCRVVRATRLSTALGLDIPRALFDVASNRNTKTKYPAEYKSGVNWLWFEAYAYSLWKNRSNISLGRELCSLMMRIPRVRAWAYFDIRDPGPSLLLALTARRRLKLLQNPGERLAERKGRVERSVSG
jgi:predicted ATP-grasp superfamily ATP-dependent carboligase